MQCGGIGGPTIRCDEALALVTKRSERRTEMVTHEPIRGGMQLYLRESGEVPRSGEDGKWHLESTGGGATFALR
jgi:hypothetical protein